MTLSAFDLLVDDGAGTPQTIVHLNNGASKYMLATALRDGDAGALIERSNPLSVSNPVLITASASFTRPADTTAYAFGDLVANNTTAGSVTPLTIPAITFANDAKGRVTGGKLYKSGTTPTNAIFRIHLFSASPTVNNGDNGAFSCADKDTYLGSLDASTSLVFTDGCFGYFIPNFGDYVAITPATGTDDIFALIEARDAYTPASAEVFTVVLHGE